MVVGTGYAEGDTANGSTLSMGIGIQNERSAKVGTFMQAKDGLPESCAQVLDSVSMGKTAFAHAGCKTEGKPVLQRAQNVPEGFAVAVALMAVTSA